MHALESGFYIEYYRYSAYKSVLLVVDCYNICYIASYKAFYGCDISRSSSSSCCCCCTYYLGENPFCCNKCYDVTGYITYFGYITGYVTSEKVYNRLHMTHRKQNPMLAIVEKLAHLLPWYSDRLR